VRFGMGLARVWRERVLLRVRVVHSLHRDGEGGGKQRMGLRDLGDLGLWRESIFWGFGGQFCDEEEVVKRGYSDNCS
jgi:hypothetical protein